MAKVTNSRGGYRLITGPASQRTDEDTNRRSSLSPKSRASGLGDEWDEIERHIVQELFPNTAGR